MDHLTPAQATTLKQRLDALHAELTASLAGADEGSKPVDLERPIGRLSRMDAMLDQQMATAQRRRQQQRLQRVEQALQAWTRGTYGICPRCEEPIGVRRLEAAPDVVLCIACLEELEAER